MVRPIVGSFGLVALAGCGFQLALTTDSAPSPDDAPVIDGADPDAPRDSMPPPDTEVTSLVDRGLVARYFIDAAPSGQLPTVLADSASSPLALPITFGPPLSFLEDNNGNRGLHWTASQTAGKVEIALGTTKLRTRLAMSRTTVTIEVVVQIASGGPLGSDSQITGLRGGNPDFMLTAFGSNGIRFFKPYGAEGGSWNSANTQQRMVLHLVYDTTRQDPDARIELYRNGVALPKSTSMPPAMASAFSLAGGDVMIIGNRQDETRSLSGTIFYVAYYDVALSEDEIDDNVDRLLANDDE